MRRSDHPLRNNMQSSAISHTHVWPGLEAGGESSSVVLASSQTPTDGADDAQSVQTAVIAESTLQRATLGEIVRSKI